MNGDYDLFVREGNLVVRQILGRFWLQSLVGRRLADGSLAHRSGRCHGALRESSLGGVAAICPELTTPDIWTEVREAWRAMNAGIPHAFHHEKRQVAVVLIANEP